MSFIDEKFSDLVCNVICNDKSVIKFSSKSIEKSPFLKSAFSSGETEISITLDYSKFCVYCIESYLRLGFIDFSNGCKISYYNSEEIQKASEAVTNELLLELLYISLYLQIQIPPIYNNDNLSSPVLNLTGCTITGVFDEDSIFYNRGDDKNVKKVREFSDITFSCVVLNKKPSCDYVWFKNCHFEYVDFSGLLFKAYTMFDNCTFSYCNFNNTILPADIERCKFNKCSMSNMIGNMLTRVRYTSFYSCSIRKWVSFPHANKESFSYIVEYENKVKNIGKDLSYNQWGNSFVLCDLSGAELFGFTDTTISQCNTTGMICNHVGSVAKSLKIDNGNSVVFVSSTYKNHPVRMA